MHTKTDQSRKRKICIFCQTWESGGIESFLYTLLHHIDLSHVEIDIVVENLKESVFQSSLEQLDVTFYELSGSTRHIVSNYRRFAALMQRRKYDVLHLNVFQAQAMMYLPLAKHNQIPIRIVHSHNTALRDSRTQQLKLWIHYGASRIFSRYATDWWACSSAAARFMFPKQIISQDLYCFVPNGIELKKFRFDLQVRKKIREALGLNQCFVIGNVGRLCHQKNQAFLLDFLPEIRKKIPESKLILVGTGDDLLKLRQRANDRELSDHVIFCGTCSHVEQLLWSMDVFAFPSRFEGLGIGLIEAQAAGLPAVCSDQIPPEAIVSSDTVCLPLCDRDAWIQTLVQLHGRHHFRDYGNSDLRKFDAAHVGRWVEEKYLQPIAKRD